MVRGPMPFVDKVKGDLGIRAQPLGDRPLRRAESIAPNPDQDKWASPFVKDEGGRRKNRKKGPG